MKPKDIRPYCLNYKKYPMISQEEVAAIYYCISSTMDLRDEIEWKNEKQYWSEWNHISKNIDIALVAANKLDGYKNTI